jgi:hypothetical protein
VHHAAAKSKLQTLVSERTPWRDRPLQTMQIASEIAGLSVAALYRAAGEDRLKLRRLEGRTLVETSSLIELIEAAASWTPSNRGAAARAKRAKVARSALRD